MNASIAPVKSRLSPQFARLAHLFLVDSLADTCALRETSRHGNLQGALALGHRLKGAGGTFGYPHLSDLGACLQSIAEAGHHEASTALISLITSRLRELIATGRGTS